METGAAGVLRMGKKTYDVRGPEANLLRQLAFNPQAFFHMLFYRILILFGLFAFAFYIFSLFFISLSSYLNYLIVIIWVLFTPQLFSLMMGLSMVMSNGFAFGHLNSSYKSLVTVNKHANLIYRAVPFIGLVFWIAALVWFVSESII